MSQLSPKYRDWMRILGAPEDPVATDTSSEWSAISLLKAIYDGVGDIGSPDLTLAGDSGSVVIQLSSETLTIAGGTGIATSGATNTITINIDDAALLAISGLTPTDGNVIVGNGSTWVAESGATARASLGLTIGTHVQAWDAQLDTWATVTPSANGQSLVSAADYAAMRTLLDLEAGTDFYSVSGANAAFQPLDADLTAVAALTTTAAGRSTLAIADPGVDRIIAWDDTAGAMAAIALGDITAEAAPATGDYVLIYGAEGDLRKVDWSALPGAGGGIAEVVEDTTPQLGGMLDVNGQAIGDGTRELLTFIEDASAVNHVNIENQATGGGPIISAVGDDTDIDLLLAGKGTGVPKIGANAILDDGRIGVTVQAYDADTAKLDVAQSFTAKQTFSAANVETPVALSDGANVALDASLGNVFTLSAAGSRTMDAPTNATNGQKIVIRHLASGGARTLTLTTGSAGAFRYGSDITVLTETASGKIDYIGCIYNGTDSRWDVVAYAKGY
jgi:hypothetical protein